MCGVRKAEFELNIFTFRFQSAQKNLRRKVLAYLATPPLLGEAVKPYF